MYLESRRTFLKGAAFTVAGATLAKGVFTTDAIKELSLRHGIYTPIVDEVYEVFHGKSVQKSLKDLLS